MKILAIDTALPSVSVCVIDAAAETPEAVEAIPMQRGHAEALVPMVDRAVARVEGGFAALGRVAVTVGPGSFTGLRVGIAAARAIGLACKIPVVGVSTLAAIAAPLILEQLPGLVVAAIDARGGSVYFAAFGPYGKTVVAPRIADAREALRALGAGPLHLAGPGARLLAAEATAAGTVAEIAGSTGGPDIVFVAKLGLLADPAAAPPRPLYFAPPSARPLEAGAAAPAPSAGA
jgi:tRNA threonylcarbamoyl adenosine modification protein YeaZ